MEAEKETIIWCGKQWIVEKVENNIGEVVWLTIRPDRFINITEKKEHETN